MIQVVIIGGIRLYREGLAQYLGTQTGWPSQGLRPTVWTAYVSRDGQLGDVVLAIRGATRGEMVASPRIAGALVRRVAALAAQRPPLPELDGLSASTGSSAESNPAQG